VKHIAACLLVAAALQGCARGPSVRDTSDARREANPFADARPAAAALVFEPAMAGTYPPPDLARDGRQPEAFVGYAEGVTEYFYVRWDDRQGNWGTGRHGGGNYDRFERRAVSEKVGALYR
jgi:hypothetical protein